MKFLLSAVTAASLLTLSTVVSAGAVNLVEDNFDDSIAGKNAFVKFYAPWCQYCRAMKEAWDQLGDEFACSSYVIIGDVDCTAEENQNLCEKMEVNSYPTIKYWKDGIMEDYQGGRDFDSLKQHVVENLLGLCNVADPKDCTRKENAYIEKMKAKTQDQIERQHANLGKLEQWLHQRLHILESLREERRTNFR